MAVFRGTTLYHRTTDQDQSWGTDIRALLSSAAADTDWTQTFTSTTAHFQTTDPYTNTTSSATNDTRTNHGWALNEAAASADSMWSTATRKRYTLSGNWQFSTAIAWSAPALLESYDIYIEYSVYRVATGGGTRTLLFSVNSNTQNVTLVSGSGTLSASSSQSEYLFEPGETMHVAMRINSKATSALLGSTTNTVITVKGATSGALKTTLPSPGLRDLFFDSNAAVGAGVGERSLLVTKDYDAVGAGVGTIERIVEYVRGFDAVGAGIGDITKVVIFVRGFDAVGVSTITARIELDFDDLPDGGAVVAVAGYSRCRVVNK